MSTTDKVKDSAAKVVNRLHSELFRRSGGRMGGSFKKAPVLLLTTTGKRSGQARTVPLLYLRDGDALVLVASYGGDDRAPAWFHNLLANPEVRVELSGTKATMRARVADAQEKARLWPQVVAMYSGYAKYQTKTQRDIPLVVLTPT